MRVVEIHSAEAPAALASVIDGVLTRHQLHIGWSSPWEARATRGNLMAVWFGSCVHLDVRVEVMVSTIPGASSCGRLTREKAAVPSAEPAALLELADEFEQLCDEVASAVEASGRLVEIRKHR